MVKLTKLENLDEHSGNWKIKLNTNNRIRNRDDGLSWLVTDSLKKNLIKPFTIQLKPLAGDELEKYLESEVSE